MPKSLSLIAVTLALLASGFSLDGVAAQKSGLKRTEVFMTEGLVVRMPVTYVSKSNLLLPRKK